jgi:hypothetical protein
VATIRNISASVSSSTTHCIGGRSGRRGPRAFSQAKRLQIVTFGLPHCFNSLNLAVRRGFLFHQISY